MKKTLDKIKKEISLNQISEQIEKWIFLKSRETPIENYGDIDIFVIIKDKKEMFELTKKVSKIAANLTISLDKYVTVFPIHKSDFNKKESQFIKNLHIKGIVL